MNTETRPLHKIWLIWRKLISQHMQSALSVKAFCQNHAVCEQSFYSWRNRLSEDRPARFAKQRPASLLRAG
jgi:transposase-like protein